MVIDGKKIASDLEQALIQKLTQMPSQKVAFVLFGTNSASEQFITMKSRTAERAGIMTQVFTRPGTITTDEAISYIQDIANQGYNGIVVQLPLPAGMDTERILDAVPVTVDIDVLGSHAKQAYINKQSKKFPPVARAINEIFKACNVDLNNKKIVLFGNGRLVGQSVGMMFDHDAIAYSIINTDTSEAEKNEYLQSADIIISGAGIPHIIQQDMIKEGCILIDAGTSEQAGKLVGDIDPACGEKASLISPVPGGVGPITVISLFWNLLED
jgi:methylenetetrahydrofolate dehydrogenase (NADP+)/methenyltetrahydrofolate cyclohydrolase